MKYRIFLACSLIASVTSACDQPASPGNASTASTAISSTTENEPPETPTHYSDHEGSKYFYVSAVSENDKKQGRAIGDVLTFEYLGVRNDRHIVQQISDSGNVVSTSECANPCRIIKDISFGRVSRIPYNPESVIGSVFEDAINGKLEAKSSPKSVDRPEVAPAPRSRPSEEESPTPDSDQDTGSEET